MPRIFLPASAWTPDYGIVRNPGMTQVENAWWTINGLQGPSRFTSGNAFATPYSIPLPRTATGFGHHPLDFTAASGGTLYVAYGTALDADCRFFCGGVGGVAMTNCGTVAPVGATDSSSWQMAPFAGYMFFARLDFPLQGDVVGAFAVGNAIGSADKPRAAYIAATQSRIVLASIANTGTAGSPDPNPNLVWWSATDDPTVFGNPASHPVERTDFQSLPDDHGNINGLASLGDAVYVFKPRAIYKMESGGPFGFTFRRIATGIGLQVANTTVAIGEELYFWSNRGPAVIRFDQVSELAPGKILRTLNDPGVLGEFYLPLNQGIIAYPDSETTTGAFYDQATDSVGWVVRKKILTYHRPTGNFALQQLADASDVIGLEPLMATTWSAPYPVGASGSPAGATGLLLSQRRPTGTLSYETQLFFHNSTSKRTRSTNLTWPFFAPNEQRLTRITRIRPVVTSPSAVSVAYVLRATDPPVVNDSSWDEYSGTVTPDSAHGWDSTPSTKFRALWSILLAVDGAVSYLLTEIEGVEIEFEEGGTL